MEATFVIDVNELDDNFIDALKKAFAKTSKIRIKVEAEIDETQHVEKFQGDSIRTAELQLQEGQFISFNSAKEITEWLNKETGILID